MMAGIIMQNARAEASEKKTQQAEQAAAAKAQQKRGPI